MKEHKKKMKKNMAGIGYLKVWLMNQKELFLKNAQN